MHNEKLGQAGIPKEQWEHCYVGEDGTIFTPVTDEEHRVLRSGQEMYREWLASR